MRCSFCGNEVEDGAKFCPVCGTKMTSKDSDKEVKYEDPNSGQNGYNDGNLNDGQSGYNYGEPNSDPSGYSYGNPNSGQSGYNYGGSNSGQNGYNYGQSGSGFGTYNQPGNMGGYPQQGKQISGTPYLIFSILVTLCCCLPLGVAGIVYASKINSLQRAGDYAGAQAAAKKARIFTIVGAVGGLIAAIVLGIMGIMEESDSSEIVSSSNKTEIVVGDDADENESANEEGASAKKIETNGELGDNWMSYTVQINDTVLTFPCSIEEVEAIGLTMDTEDTPEDYVVNKDDYELVFFDDSNQNSLMFMLCNNTDEAKTVKECVVSGIYVDEYDVEDGNLTIIFPGGIQIGADIDTVIQQWGEPDDTYEGSYSNSYGWYDSDSYNYCTLSVDPDTNKVTAIDLDGQDLK